MAGHLQLKLVQYADGDPTPADISGFALVFDSNGTLVDVGADFPLPVQTTSLPAGTALIGHVIVDNVTNPGFSLSGASSPVILPIDQYPPSAVLNGTAYSVCTGWITAAAAGSFPFALFNPAGNSKNILVYSIVVACLTTGASYQVNTIVADPAFGTNPVPIPAKTNAPASSLTTSISYQTTSITAPGSSTFIGAGRVASNSDEEAFRNNRIHLLTKGQNSGLQVTVIPTAACQWLVAMCYIEF